MIFDKLSPTFLLIYLISCFLNVSAQSSCPSPTETLSNADSCPPGWYFENTTQICYYYDSTLLDNFNNAEIYCESLYTGSYLPVFCSAAEYTGYNTFLQNANVSCTIDHWIGISDTQNVGTFMQVDGNVPSYFQFDSSYPTCDGQPSCVSAVGWWGPMWQTNTCSQNKAFLCQYRPLAYFQRTVGYYIVSGGDVTTYGGVTESTCLWYCILNSQCVGYTVNSVSTCWLKNITDAGAGADWVYGIKQTSTNVCGTTKPVANVLCTTTSISTTTSTVTTTTVPTTSASATTTTIADALDAPATSTSTTPSSAQITLPPLLTELGIDQSQVAAGASLTATLQDSTPFIMNTLNASMKQQLGVQLTDLIYTCSFNSVPCDMQNDFTNNYSPLLGNCYTFNPGAHPKYWSSRAGSLNGLRIVLAAGQSDYSCSSTMAGFRIVIHENSEIPFPDAQGLYVPPGTVNSVTISHLNFLRLGHHFGSCAPSQFGLFNGNYSVEACQRYCFQTSLMQTCKCADPRYPLPPNATYCAAEQKSCLDFSQQCEEKIVSGNQCNCPPLCNETLYKTTVTSAKMQLNYLKTAFCNGTNNSSMCSGDFSKNFGLLYIYYQEITSFTFYEASTYGISNVYSDFSGVTGLLLGVCIITVVEIFFYFGFCVIKCCHQNIRSVE